MKTIVIASQKGGAGKTTTAANLSVAAASEGLRVGIIDLDPQGSLRTWWNARAADAPMMPDVDPPPAALPAAQEALQPLLDLLIIDTPPAAPDWLPAVMTRADLVLMPVRPSGVDLWAVGATLRAAREAKAEVICIMSQTPRARITDEAARELAGYARVAPVNIAMRVAHAEALSQGLGSAETSDAKAAAEARELWAYVWNALNV